MVLDPMYAAREAEALALGPAATEAEVEAVMARPYGAGERHEVEVTSHQVAGPHGSVPVRVYCAPGTSPGDRRPGLVWCHGGAFMWGDLDMPEADQTARGIVGRTGGVVVSVDYRLTGAGDPPLQPPVPEALANQYPVAHDDVHAAWLWTVDQADHLGLDPQRTAIGGASAGANLSGGVLLRLRDEGAVLPRVWLAIYPAAHTRELPFSPDLVADLAEHNSGFTPETLAFIGQCYGATADDRYGYIGERADLQGLPRVLIVNDQYDELRGSGEALADQLQAAGVEVTTILAEGMKHGHLNLVGHPVTQQTLDQMAEAILG